MRTDELVESIIEGISEGVPLAELCRQEGMPKLRTVYDWLDADADLSARFARARKAGYDALAVKALRIASTTAEGIEEKWEPRKIENPDDPDAPPTTELQLVERRVGDMLGHRKLQVDTILKLLSKWDPGRYGEKHTLQHQGTIGLEALVAGSGPDVGTPE